MTYSYTHSAPLEMPSSASEKKLQVIIKKETFRLLSTCPNLTCYFLIRLNFALIQKPLQCLFFPLFFFFFVAAGYKAQIFHQWLAICPQLIHVSIIGSLTHHINLKIDGCEEQRTEGTERSGERNKVKEAEDDLWPICISLVKQMVVIIRAFSVVCVL